MSQQYFYTMAVVEIWQSSMLWWKTLLCVTEELDVTIVTIVRTPAGRNRHQLEGVCLSETLPLATF